MIESIRANFRKDARVRAPFDVDSLIDTFDKRKKAGPKPGEPAWRRLERYREDRETAELLSDLDDYDIGDGESRRKRRN